MCLNVSDTNFFHDLCAPEHGSEVTWFIYWESMGSSSLEFLFSGQGHWGAFCKWLAGLLRYYQ